MISFVLGIIVVLEINIMPTEKIVPVGHIFKVKFSVGVVKSIFRFIKKKMNMNLAMFY